jgi:hypothetical protein
MPVGGDAVSVNLEPIIAHWTHCYHVTAAINLQSFRRFGILLPAATLFRLTDRGDLLKRRRTDDVRLQLQGQKVLVRNQTPLDPNSINVGPTETLEDYVACLNAHVFFWPGTASGPTHDGIRMLRRAAGVKSAMIRVPSRSLLEANEGSLVHLSTCNTGASWVVDGQRSQRGLDVFQRAECFAEPPGRIEEISFRGPVNLPDDCECSTGFGQGWHALFVETHGRQRTKAIDRWAPG